MTLTLERPTVAPVLEPAADPDKLVIDVRQEHIDRGTMYEPTRCAIALAAREATGDALASMGRSQLTVNGESWMGGKDVMDFTYAFDSGFPVYPGVFRFKRAAWRSPDAPELAV